MRASQALLLILFCALGTSLFSSPAPMAVPSRAFAQDDSNRTPAMPGKPRPDLPQDGSYLAGDSLRFFLDRYHGYERLRIAGNDEVYYLNIEPAALGGRVLKYDSGDVALQVSGWGGITIYTREAPGGLPAERLGETPEQANAAVPDVKKLAVRVSEEIQDKTGLTIGFRANWDALNQFDETRMLAAEAIRNSAYAIERIVTSRRTGQILLSRFDVVRIAVANDVSTAIDQKLLTLHIVPSRGMAGRPSSVAISKAIREKL